MIRIRPGRNWRLNPAYVGELRSLSGAHARDFSGGGILDVLGIEVDGVDIAAGVGEGHVLLAVDELTQALLALSDGAPAAQATIGPGPTELVIESRGDDLLLALLSLGRPARLLASGLLVDAAAMRKAALNAARGLLFDLLGISPRLGDAGVARRLGEACGLLARPPRQAALAPFAQREARPALLGTATAFTLSLSPQLAARLRARSAVPRAPLAAHLGTGTLSLRRRGAAGLAADGVPLLLLRNLLREAKQLVEAWEAGDRTFTLHLGQHELRCDLTTDEVRASGLRDAARFAAPELATRVAGLCIEYAALSQRPRNRTPDVFADGLREEAEALLRHATDLLSGDLRRAAAPVPHPAPPASRVQSRGELRRLVYREPVRVSAPGASRVWLLPEAVVALPAEVRAHGAEGALLWGHAARTAPLVRGRDVTFADGETVVRMDAGGELRWKRRLRGFRGALLEAGSGVGCVTPDGVAVVDAAGAIAFTARLASAPTAVAACEGALVLLVEDGLVALDPAGALLWKRRLRVRALAAAGDTVLLLGRALFGLDALTGAQRWEADARGEGLLLAGGVAFVHGGAEVRAVDAVRGALRGAAALPAAHLACDDGDAPAVFATGPGVARLDGRARIGWRSPQPASGPAQALAGVVLAGDALLDARRGYPLATLPAARQAALGADLRVAQLAGDDLLVHRLATHLSVVTTSSARDPARRDR